MELAYALAVAAVAAVLAAILAALLVLRRISVPSGAGGDSDALVRLTEEVSALKDARSELERRLAVEEQKASRVAELEAALRERSAAADGLRDLKADAEKDAAAAREALEAAQAALAEMRSRIGELQGEARDRAVREDELTRGKADLESRLAAREEALARVEAATDDLRRRLVAALESADAARALGDELRRERADLEGQLAARAEALSRTEAVAADLRERLETERRSLTEARARIDAETKAHADLRIRHAALRETLDQERSQAAERLALMADAKERLTTEFKLLADEMLKRHGEAFAKQNREQVDSLLEPLRGRIVEFQQGLQASQTESAKERAALAEQIRTLGETSARMTQETLNLTRALKGKAQTQGAWGEMILSTILERSGLRNGEEYVTQESRTAEDGTRLRPDVVVRLPGGQSVVIDSKVSLTAFEAYVNAEADHDRVSHLTRHVTSVRTHVRSLGGKGYHQVTEGVLDYVVMFVPIEGALAAALQEDPGLTGFAAEQGVAIATPATLMAMLRTVANVWHVERRNRNADEIAERAGKLFDKFVGFVADMQQLGSRLDGAQKCWSDAMGKLHSGRGNLVRQVEMLREMGARTSKSLPPELLDGARINLPRLAALAGGEEEAADGPAAEVVAAS